MHAGSPLQNLLIFEICPFPSIFRLFSVCFLSVSSPEIFLRGMQENTMKIRQEILGTAEADAFCASKEEIPE